MDNKLLERVYDALSDNPRTRDAGIEVLAENGIVTLRGTVSKPEVSEAAESVAEDVDGVVSVVNEVQVPDREDVDDDNPFDVSGTLDEDIIVK